MLDSSNQTMESKAPSSKEVLINPRMRVLHVIGKMDRAGAETMVMNLMRTIDQHDVTFDFLVHTNETADYDDEITKLGGHIYRVPAFTVINRRAYRTAVEAFFDSADHPHYDIVHGHIGSCASIYLDVARKHGAKTIAHSHNIDSASPLSAAAYRLLTRSVIKYADYFIGCSYEAGASRFGQDVVDSDKFEVLLNGINCKNFRFDEHKRKQIRTELGLSANELLIGHVGRFNEQKNHDFLLDIFAVVKALRADAKLALVGRGELEEKARRKAKALGIADSVLFLGIREDIPQLLSAFDVFSFPSRYEGQPVALLEAQAAGLPCVIADTIPPVSHITDVVSALPLADADIWANAIVSAAERTGTQSDRTKRADAIIEAGYDISTSSARLIARYESLLNNTEERGIHMSVKLNPDKEIVAVVREGLKRTGGYCPCKIVQSEDTKCMCTEFKEQIADPEFHGFCHCMLYYKE
ncbi:MAG: glycosyltransferase [Eggerthellaceae bacterium]|nr:glycosyltransferase [Eggerthellaceae bacterium]